MEESQSWRIYCVRAVRSAMPQFSQCSHAADCLQCFFFGLKRAGEHPIPRLLSRDRRATVSIFFLSDWIIPETAGCFLWENVPTIIL